MKMKVVKGEKVYKNFVTCMKELSQQIESNQNNIYTLEDVRDTLLPKLISGEVDVSGFENKNG